MAKLGLKNTANKKPKINMNMNRANQEVKEIRNHKIYLLLTLLQELRNSIKLRNRGIETESTEFIKGWKNKEVKTNGLTSYSSQLKHRMLTLK